MPDRLRIPKVRGQETEDKPPPRRSSHRKVPLAGLALLGLCLEPRPQPAPAWEPLARLLYDPALFAPGDLVFRRGRDLVSDVVVLADAGGRYSHVGLITLLDREVWVIHATPPEEKGKGGVVAEPLSTFLAPGEASAAALYRPRKNGTGAAVEAAWGYVLARLPFDDLLDLSNPDKLYCTELVWRAYLAAGVDLEHGVPSPRGRYLLPSRLQQSPKLRLVRKFQEEISIP